MKKKLILIAVLLSCLFLIAFLEPIYSDELVSPMVFSRWFQDHGVTAPLMPQCFKPGFLMDPDWFYVPYEWVSSMFYLPWSSPWIIKLTGVLWGVLMTIAMTVLGGQVIKPQREPEQRNKEAGWVIGALLGFLGLGIEPLIFASNRPESMCLAALVFSATLVLWRPSQNKRIEALRVGGVLLAAYVALIGHPRTLFFLPFFLLCGLLVSQSFISRSLSVVLPLIMAFSVVERTSIVSRCPESASITKQLLTWYLPPQLIVSDFWLFLKLFAFDVSKIGYYFGILLFQDSYTLEWLSPQPLNFGHHLANVLIVFFQILMTVPLIVAILRMFKARGWMHYRCSMILVLLVCLISYLGFNGDRKYYQLPMVHGVLCMAWILAIPEARQIFGDKILGPLSRAIVPVFALSTLMLIATFGPNLWKPSFGFKQEAQRMSFSPLEADRARSDILALFSQCGFNGNNQSPRIAPRIAIDEFSYMPLKDRIELPALMLYVGRGWGRDIPDFRTFMKEHGYEGALARCSEFKTLKNAEPLTKKGEVCCLKL